MRFDYHQPDGAWRDLIAIYFRLHSVAAPISITVPALSPNIQILLAGRIGYRFPDGRRAPAPQVAVLGPTLAAFEMDYAPGSEMLCVSLLPAGWQRLVGCPADRFTDRLIDAGALWPASALADLVERLQATGEIPRRVRIVERFLAARIAATGDAAARCRGIDAWLEGDPRFSLDHLCETLDLGARQIGRLTLDMYGASPKQLAMKYRALRGASLLAVRGAAAMSDAALGYYDQPHMIRDFRRFIGVTPGALLADRNNAVAMSLGGRWRAGARRPLGLWS